MNDTRVTRTFLLIFTSILAGLLLMSGCANRVTVHVNSITNDSIKSAGHRYLLTNNAGEVEEKDLYFQEFSHYFQAVLKQQGYTRVSSKKDADVEIRFAYGLSDGRTGISTYAWPIYDTIGGDIITITEKTTDSSGNPVTTTRTIRVPTRIERVGSSIETRSYTLFNRTASLKARLLDKEGKPGEVLWIVSISSVGESNDLRAIMPYLAVAAEDFIGKNTGQQREIEIDRNDPRVKALKKMIH